MNIINKLNYLIIRVMINLEKFKDCILFVILKMLNYIHKNLRKH